MSDETTTHLIVVEAPPAAIAAFAGRLTESTDLFATFTNAAAGESDAFVSMGFAVTLARPYELKVVFHEHGQEQKMLTLDHAAQNLSRELSCLVTYHWYDCLSSEGGENRYVCGRLIVSFDSAVEERTCGICATVVDSLIDMAAVYTCVTCADGPHAWKHITHDDYDDPPREGIDAHDQPNPTDVCPF